MSNGNDSDRQGGGGFVGGFVIGALVGAAVAMLLAPAPGEDTRDIVWGKAREATNFAADATGDIREKVTTVASDLQATAADLYERGRTVIDSARSNVGDAVNEGQQAAQATRQDLTSNN